MPQQQGELRVLARLGPFEGGDWTTEPSYLGEGMGSDMSNVDVSYKTHAFTIARGRTLVASNVIPAGYYVTGLCQFTELSGPILHNPQITDVRLLIISATSITSSQHTCIYNTATGTVLDTTGTLLPFTDAVQFQDGVYTNAGQQIRIKSWGGPLSIDGMNLIISAWQVARPPASSFISLDTTSVSTGPGPGTYSYAIAYLIGRGTAQQVKAAGIAAPSYIDTTFQLSQPYYIPTTVTIDDTTTAPVLTYMNPMPNPFPTFNAGGDYTIIPVFFRASVTQPVYFQLPVNGLGSPFTDISSDSLISSNASILSPSIGVPPPFVFFLEQGFPAEI